VIKEARASCIDNVFVRSTARGRARSTRRAAVLPRCTGPRPIHAMPARIDATNYALANDDGAAHRDYRSANVVLNRRVALRETPTSFVPSAPVRRVRGELSARGGRARGGELPRALAAAPPKALRLIVSPNSPADLQRTAPRQPFAPRSSSVTRCASATVRTKAP